MLSETADHPSKHSFPAGPFVFFLVLALSLSLPACSRTDTLSTAPREAITIAYSTPPYTVLIDIAQSRGYFAKEGLDVTPRTYPYGKIAFDALLRGEADVATVGETPFMFAAMHGEKLSIIATIQTSNRNNAIIARKDKGIITPADLKGAKIGVTIGTIGEFFMDAFLASNGISRKQMKFIDLPPEKMKAALESGKVDAVSTWSPVLGHLQRELGEKVAVFYDAEIYTQTFNIAARQEYIAGNAGKIKRLLHALRRADKFIEQHPEEARSIIAARSGMDLASTDEMWKDNEFDVTLDQQLVLALEDESRWAIKNGLVKNTKIPNYLNAIYLDGLASVDPKAVRILR